MNDVVIKAENLGKMYTIGHQAQNERYLALRDVMMQNARNLWVFRGHPFITMPSYTWTMKLIGRCP